MDLEELKKLKEELKKVYEEEKSNNNDIVNKEVYENELKDIEKEQFKVDKMIEIYQNSDKNYIVMKLERLYMMLVSNMSENKFDELSDDDLFDIFDKSFPYEWVYKYSNEEKEQLLLDAISNNRIIQNQKAKKYWYGE